MDVLKGLPVVFMVSDDVSVEAIEVEKKYDATISVYTVKDTGGVAKEYLGFFEVLDVDQSFEDFVKAYWMYPDRIMFELTSAESV